MLSVSAEQFVTGAINFQVYGPVRFTIAPDGKAGTPGEVGSVNLAQGHYITNDVDLAVNYTYTVVGDPENPTHGFVRMFLVDATADASNEQLLTSLGLSETNRFAALEINFNYLTNTCDVVASGYETRTSVAGTEDVLVEISHNAKAFSIVPPGTN